MLLTLLLLLAAAGGQRAAAAGSSASAFAAASASASAGAGAAAPNACACSVDGWSGGVWTGRRGCAQHSLAIDGDDGWYCMVQQPGLCLASTPSTAFPGAAWVACEGATATAAATTGAGASGASAQAQASAAAVSGSRAPHHHQPAVPTSTADAEVTAFSGAGGASASATAEASAVATGCSLAQAVATATASASGTLMPSHGGKSPVLRLSATAVAEARALAVSPWCAAGHHAFGCTLAEAVAHAEVGGNAKEQGSGRGGSTFCARPQGAHHTALPSIAPNQQHAHPPPPCRRTWMWRPAPGATCSPSSSP